MGKCFETNQMKSFTCFYFFKTKTSIWDSYDVITIGSLITSCCFETEEKSNYNFKWLW